MFTKNITISAIVIALFAVIAFAAPVIFSNTLDFDSATASAWGGGDSDGSGGEGGTGGGDGCGGCGGPDPDPDPDPEPEPEPDPARCTYLKANGKTGTLTLPYGGGSVDLTWASVRASSATLNGDSVNPNGSQTVSVTDDASYTLYVQNGDGSDSCTVNIVVPEPPVASCDSFTASPDAFYNGIGGDVTLTWETTNAQSVSIAGVGNFADEDGSVVVNYTVSDIQNPVLKTYTLTALGADNSDSCTADVIVYPEDDRNLTCQDVVFKASDYTVAPGTTVNLNWVFTGEVATASLSPNVADPMAVDNVDVVVNNTSTYKMTIANSKNSVECPLTVKVEEEPETISCEDNVTFTASDYSLPKGGGEVTLTWTTTGIEEISINGVSSTNLNDSEVVNVTRDTTFTLRATADGDTVSCPISVDVKTGGGGSSSPRCDLDISDEKIKLGEEVTLSWNTSRTEEVRIEDNHGNVIVDTDDDDELDGEITIKPTKDTEYTLTAQRGTRERECEVEVEVEESVVVYESRSQEPRVAGITLSQVPYTGFESTPMLTMIFYTLLTLWGLFVAYAFIARRTPKVAAEADLVATHDDHFTPVARVMPSAPSTDIPANLPTAEALPKVVGYEAYNQSDNS